MLLGVVNGLRNDQLTAHIVQAAIFEIASRCPTTHTGAKHQFLSKTSTLPIWGHWGHLRLLISFEANLGHLRPSWIFGQQLVTCPSVLHSTLSPITLLYEKVSIFTKNFNTTKKYAVFSWSSWLNLGHTSHSVWKSQKKSHSTLRAKRATFIFEWTKVH